VNPTAKRPKDAKAAIAVMLDSLGDNAIISDPDTAKDGTLASINSQNPKRLDITIPVQLSGNTNIRDIGLMFGFYFGG
jgi:D-arabinose 5-phosphate isomerase GutQ